MASEVMSLDITVTCFFLVCSQKQISEISVHTQECTEQYLLAMNNTSLLPPQDVYIVALTSFMAFGG